MIEYFMTKDAESTLYYIITYNIIYKLLQYMHEPYVSNFLINISLRQGISQILNPEQQQQIWSYFKESDLLLDMSKLMLYSHQDCYIEGKGRKAFKTQYLLKYAQKIPDTYINTQVDLLSREYWFLRQNKLIENLTNSNYDIDLIKYHQMPQKLQKQMQNQAKKKLTTVVSKFNNLRRFSNL